MSQEAVERLLGRLLTDDTFRKRAGESIESLCNEAGFDLNQSELSAINRNDLLHLDFVSLRLDRRIKRMSQRGI
ncbi:MAG TPA: Franean1_4349 family RiPP [Desulfuromonadales bacterium]|nr:Franean1_4349 family RiPP [Desulfuromonadales bacterium]